MEDAGFTLIESKPLYKGTIISLFIDMIKSPEGRVMEREVVRHLDAVGIAVLTGERDIVLVTQYRHPVNRALLEIPAGLLDDGESAAECAVRELKEETGYSVEHVEKMAEFYTSAGFTDEKFHLYFSDKIEAGEPERELGEEDIQVVTLPLKTALEMALRGEIQDAKTLIAILMTAQKVGGFGA